MKKLSRDVFLFHPLAQKAYEEVQKKRLHTFLNFRFTPPEN